MEASAASPSGAEDGHPDHVEPVEWPERATGTRRPEDRPGKEAGTDRGGRAQSSVAGRR